jgi:heat shock protein HspQ
MSQLPFEPEEYIGARLPQEFEFGVQDTMVANTRFCIGDVARHRDFPFRGVIFDVDPVFSNSEEWWLSIPEDIRPDKNQPFYHMLAENEEATYIAYVSQQSLIEDGDNGPVQHPDVEEMFEAFEDGRYVIPTGFRQ